MQIDQTPRRRLLVVGLIMLVAVAVAAVVAVPAGVAQVVVPTATTTTTTPTTTTPGPTTTSPATTVPGTSPVPTNPDGEGSGLSPDQVLATQSAFAALSDTERRLLAELEAAKDTLATRQFALVTLIHQTATATNLLDAARNRATAAAAEIHATAARMHRIKHELVRLAAAVYRAGPGTELLSALDATGASDLARAKTYARSDANVLGARVVELKTLTHQLEAERTSAERAEAEAEAAAATVNSLVTAQNQAVTDGMAAAAAAQAALTSAIGSGSSLLAQVADPHFGADSIAATLAISQAGQADPTQLVGIFTLPIPGAPLGSPYGMRIDPLTGAGGFHPGLDFEASAGTPIRAAGAGLVVIAGDCGGYGNCVVIDHGTQLATVYGHQSALIAKVGDQVTVGQVIGLVGSTGLSTGPHLHFEVRLRGVPIDPVPTLGA